MKIKFRLLEEADYMQDYYKKKNILQPYIDKAISILRSCGYTDYPFEKVQFFITDNDPNYIAKYLDNAIEISYAIINPDIQYMDGYTKEKYETELISVLLHEFAHYMDFYSNNINWKANSLFDIDNLEDHTDNWKDIINHINDVTNNKYNVRQQYYLKSFDEFKSLQDLILMDNSNFPEDFPCKIKCQKCGYYKQIFKYKDYKNNIDLIDNYKSLPCPKCGNIGSLTKINRKEIIGDN